MESSGTRGPTFDIAIIGGGVNGCGIARDAAGRGWSVYLCEKDDLASSTSSASSKLIHGGLRYLENFEFRLVREALIEREILWRIAPHIVWPLRFVLPHNRDLRPAWMLRSGLFLYDHLGGRRLLPPTRTLRLADDPTGEVLKPQYKIGFEYSDCWAEDARLVVLNARDAADKGAVIAPRTCCVSGARGDGLWTLNVRDERSGRTSKIQARTLVNAGGPWVNEVLQLTLRTPPPAAVRLVKGSHIVVRRLFHHDRCYILQNKDRRVFFVIPFERDYTLIGTTDLDYKGDLDAVHISPEEVAYLCDGASGYFRAPVTADQVVWSYSGVRPLYDDGASEAQEATRDYVLKLDPSEELASASQHFRGQDHHLPKTCRGGVGASFAASAPDAQARRMDRSRRPARWRFSNRRLRNTGERDRDALSFSHAGDGAPSRPRIWHEGGKATGRGDDPIGSRSDVRRRLDRGGGPLSREKRMGDERCRYRLAALQAGIEDVRDRDRGSRRLSRRLAGSARNS